LRVKKIEKREERRERPKEIILKQETCVQVSIFYNPCSIITVQMVAPLISSPFVGED